MLTQSIQIILTAYAAMAVCVALKYVAQSSGDKESARAASNGARLCGLVAVLGIVLMVTSLTV